ncbi:hypothetical protein OG429_40195 (plasmid) [Streptomyces sp. NBC_00190]|uniref:helix-turn-helix domain-containing protein n=1 Tax=unclassified Streptomyces TaxID=2593676 RepID=UPI002E2BE608|nr:helix-turn-helix domain-containing protein [Streptomyces sp. NBC_00190]
MGEPKAVGLAAAAYAAALRAAVHGFTMQGGTQKEIAVAAHVAPATLSRYLSGDRVAPPTFVARLDSFLAERGRPLDAGVRERLDELCARAHEASRSPAVQLVILKQELARVQGEKQAGEAELAALKEHADQLAGELEQALEQARHAETGLGVLEQRVTEQDKKLQDAQAYTRRLEAELTAQHDQVVLVQREVEVLRRQNKTLLDESTATTMSGGTLEGAVPAVSTQATSGKAEREAPAPLPPRDLSTSTFKPLMPTPAPPPERRPLLGRADTKEQFTGQLRALRARAGGKRVWPAEKLAGLSPSRPYGNSSTQEDTALMDRWFANGEFPHDWRRLRPVLRGLGATSLEVKTFAASYDRIGKGRTARTSDVMTAVLVLAAMAVIYLGATAVLQSDTESGTSKTLTALGALLASAIIGGTGATLIAPNPDKPSPHAEWPYTLIFCCAPITLIASVIVPFATGTDTWGHWIADLLGLL